MAHSQWGPHFMFASEGERVIQRSASHSITWTHTLSLIRVLVWRRGRRVAGGPEAREALTLSHKNNRSQSVTHDSCYRSSRIINPPAFEVSCMSMHTHHPHLHNLHTLVVVTIMMMIALPDVTVYLTSVNYCQLRSGVQDGGRDE